MLQNYTETGFTKIRAPENVMALLLEFWEANKDKGQPENWPAGNTYVNHWESPTEMISVENKSLKHGGFVLKQHIWNAARDTIQEWTGQRLAECSLYGKQCTNSQSISFGLVSHHLTYFALFTFSGIRVYKEGAVLATHVDRLPLVSSAIINVDQDVDEPWPLEVIGHDGKAHNVTMLPGDLVLYESHSVLHGECIPFTAAFASIYSCSPFTSFLQIITGRPFPLKGRFMANVFIHFEPIGSANSEQNYGTTDIPPYVIPGSIEEGNWKARNPNGHTIMKTQEVTTGTTEAHRAAMERNLNELKVVVDGHEEVVNAVDANGWTPLHEGVRAGNAEIVQYLVDKGSDVNARTENGVGGSALWWAIKSHNQDHEIVKLLEGLGAKNTPPELTQPKQEL